MPSHINMDIERDKHSRQSSFREKLIEHLFVGELLKYSWQYRGCLLEIAKPEVDNRGYDIIAEDRKIVRHIQLKTSCLGAKAAKQKVHIDLEQKPSGCVVWVFFNQDTLHLGPFLFYGEKIGQQLNLANFKTAKHTKGNSQGVKIERPAIREIPKSQFIKYETVADIYKVLFGDVLALRGDTL